MIRFYRYAIWASAVLLCCLSTIASAQSTTLSAIDDFPNINDGAVPYYRDYLADLNVLAINAADGSHREQFARASTTFTGNPGIYDVTINALGEIDGDGEYRLFVDGVLIGSGINTPTTTDYVVQPHLFQAVSIPANAVIAVESMAVSNGLIPEGDGYAYARGRWRSLELAEVGAVQGTSVDLAITASIDQTPLQAHNDTTLLFTVFNLDGSEVATEPTVTISLPRAVAFRSSNYCSHSNGVVTCLLPQLAANESSEVKVSVELTRSGVHEVLASVESAQVESDPADNAVLIRTDGSLGDPANAAPQSGSASDSSGVVTAGGGAPSWQLLIACFALLLTRSAFASKKYVCN